VQPEIQRNKANSRFGTGVENFHIFNAVPGEDRNLIPRFETLAQEGIGQLVYPAIEFGKGNPSLLIYQANLLGKLRSIYS
jgi:hypothetical protein